MKNLVKSIVLSGEFFLSVSFFYLSYTKIWVTILSAQLKRKGKKQVQYSFLEKLKTLKSLFWPVSIPLEFPPTYLPVVMPEIKKTDSEMSQSFLLWGIR